MLRLNRDVAHSRVSGICQGFRLIGVEQMSVFTQAGRVGAAVVVAGVCWVGPQAAGAATADSAESDASTVSAGASDRRADAGRGAGSTNSAGARSTRGATSTDSRAGRADASVRSADGNSPVAAAEPTAVRPSAARPGTGTAGAPLARGSNASPGASTGSSPVLSAALPEPIVAAETPDPAQPVVAGAPSLPVPRAIGVAASAVSPVIAPKPPVLELAFAPAIIDVERVVDVVGQLLTGLLPGPISDVLGGMFAEEIG